MVDLSHLISLDDGTRAEAPEGFDRLAADVRFVAVAKTLLISFPSLTVESGSMIQDASFHGQLAISKGDAYAIIRVSNFGYLVAIFDDDHCLSPEDRYRIISEFEQNGYRFVDSDLLEREYSGKNRGVSGYRTWRERFFDYT